MTADSLKRLGCRALSIWPNKL